MPSVESSVANPMMSELVVDQNIIGLSQRMGTVTRLNVGSAHVEAQKGEPMDGVFRGEVGIRWMNSQPSSSISGWTVLVELRLRGRAGSGQSGYPGTGVGHIEMVGPASGVTDRL